MKDFSDWMKASAIPDVYYPHSNNKSNNYDDIVKAIEDVLGESIDDALNDSLTDSTVTTSAPKAEESKVDKGKYDRALGLIQEIDRTLEKLR